MIKLLVGMTIAVNAAIGVWLGTRFLKGERNNRNIIGLHLLIGFGMIEVLVVLLSKAPQGNVVAGLPLATWVAAFMAGALLTGLLTALIPPPYSRRRLGPYLAVHAAIGGGGFFAMVAWALTS